MNKTRLEAFSDGVLAILITIMVLELKVPHGTSWAELHPALETLASYALSFVYLAIYWGNHHHLLHTVSRVNGRVMWANMHLLFWLSLVPFATAWMNDTSFASISVAVYGVDMVLCAIAFTILAKSIHGHHTANAKLSEALRKGNIKANLSMLLYFSSIPLAFVEPLISCAIFVIVAIIWIVPDKEIEKILNEDRD